MLAQFGGKEQLKGRAQFVICLDGTGSMSPVMNGLKDSLKVFIEALKEPVDVKGGQGEFAIKEWKGRLLVFRDLEVDGSLAMEEGTPFVTAEDELKSHIDAVEPVGGGDPPESVLDAIFRAARNSDWENGWAHFIIVFTDAPTKPLHESTLPAGDLEVVKQELKKEKIYLIMFAPRCPEYEELRKSAEAMSEQAAEAWVLKEDPDATHRFFEAEFNKDRMASLCKVLGKTISGVSSGAVL